MPGAITREKNGSIIFWDGDGVFPCGECSTFADYLCDFPIGEGKTCDANLCEMHAHPIADEKHLCPIHFAAFQATGAMSPIKIDRITIVQDATE